MKKMLSLSRKHYILILVIVFIGLGLYWFELKPNMVRQSCAEEATNKYRGYGSPIANNYYRLCLVRHLMKPESLFVR